MGAAWPGNPLETHSVWRFYLLQMLMIGLSLGLPLITTAGRVSALLGTFIVVPVAVVFYGFIMASLLILPPTLALYGRALLGVAASSVHTIMSEREGNTLMLLRTTPFSLREIFLGKIASGIWKQAENLNDVLLFAGLLSLPPVVLSYAALWPPDQYPYLSRLGMALGLSASLLRLFVEPVMAGAVGILVGSVASFRIVGVIWATVLLGSYFLLLNLMRLLPLDMPLRLVVEVLLPLLLPLLITWAALHAAEHALRRD